MKAKSLPFIASEHKRDAYGFAVRPQHLQRYREYANIYKEEEEERSERWKNFLDSQAEYDESSGEDQDAKVSPSAEDEEAGKKAEDGRDAYGFAVRPQHLQRYREYANIYKEEEEERSERWKNFLDSQAEYDESSGEDQDAKVSPSAEDEEAGKKAEDGRSKLSDEQKVKQQRPHKIQIWSEIRPSLGHIGEMMSLRVKKKQSSADKENAANELQSANNEEIKPSEDSDDEFYDVEKVDPNPEGPLWQAFVGIGARRVKGYYESLLAADDERENSKGSDSPTMEGKPKGSPFSSEKWKGQIEKDLPRTFPGHPALDEDGRNALRRLLTAYARHNPSVGYCQAMNFFAGLLLLLMPEENAFWALTGIMDDYFDGYFSEEMIECQVDQLVLEELVREKFPKLVNHLDYLGVQVAWVTGPWFLSIFMNMLPWESVLRVWDVLLFDGNRVMLFRTALALMELYGPALVTTKDAGDAVTLLQSLAGSTFDSSQLVLTACMGYQAVDEARLQELRNKHRPSVISSMEQRAKGLRVWRDTNGLASKLYNFKRDPEPLVSLSTEQLSDLTETSSGSTDDMYSGLTVNTEIDSLPDPKDQVVWLKVELCQLLEERRSAVLRADELETALMEMVKQDNRRELSAKVEQLEQELSDLRQALLDKQEQEQAMLQVLMRVEQEQKVTEDARIFAEQDAAAQKYAAHVLQEKYEEAMASLAQMENRAVMAETMLEATLQYQSSQQKAQLPSPSPSPRTPTRDASPGQVNQDSSQEFQPRRISLLAPFSLGWRDKNKGKQNISDESTNGNLNSNTEQMVDTPKKDDEKQGDSPQEGEQRVDTPRRDSEHRLDTPETTIKLEEQLEEIKLD
ncbi:hypothetical protein OsJ_03987 [Oryza sativa Japonica Group]|uniref:Rab-GAP TBC domain-containing protein n=1 Tax=Oryza sativa subsp. japonica TaxID=39947 RepID=B9EUB5_ORYSJ|nr:hypothetical protein OsJ_03987 [Oryza sativa Japonica Group]